MKSAHITLLFFYSLVVITLSACTESNTANNEPIIRPVRTMTVAKSYNGSILEFPAIVDAAHSADLSFKVAGEVVALLIKQGEKVNKGDLIARLDDTNYKLALNEAQASYDKAQADFNRAKKLITSNTIAESDYDRIKAQAVSAQSKLANAKNNLHYTKLHASFDGILARTYIEEYEEVQAKQTIATLQNIEQIKVKVNVPERIIVSISKEEVEQNIYATFSAIPDKEFQLNFVEISTQADEITKTYEITLGMDSLKGYYIFPGMTAQVLVKLQHAQNMIHIPIKTVLKDGAGYYVWTVKDSGNGMGTIIKNRVTIGKITDLGFNILSGLKEGDRVVTAGMSKVTAGQTVKIREEL